MCVLFASETQPCFFDSSVFPPPLLTTTTSTPQWCWTPLHRAAQYGQVAACTSLLEAGATVDAQDEVCVSVSVGKRMCIENA